MRQVLFEVPVQGEWNLGQFSAPGFGFGILLAVWAVVGFFTLRSEWKKAGGWTSDFQWAICWWAAIAVAIVMAPKFLPEKLQLFGYGSMLVCAVVFSGWTGAVRAKLVGVPRAFAWDLAVWLVLAGVVGSRGFYLLQYHARVYKDCVTIQDYLLATINLPDGGLVLYGGLIFASLTYLVHCRMRGVDPLKFADAAVPAVFVGVAFGRMGCFLNGCCFGDACDLPWAVQFPAKSVTWSVLVQRGFLDPDAPATMLLHPTQLYSSLNGLILAALTAAYYRYRAGDGSVVALAMMTYPVSRICVEILRGDEMGQLGTGLTISQLVSLGVLCAGIALARWSWTHSEARLTSSASTEAGGQASLTA